MKWYIKTHSFYTNLIVDPSINSLTVQLHEPMTLLWYVRTAFFATLKTLPLGLNSKQALSWFCSATKLLNKVSALVTWSSTGAVGGFF